MTITKIIDEYREKIINSPDLQLMEASEYLTKLSALLGNINEEIRLRDRLYANKLLEIMNEGNSVAKAKVIAQTTDEYQNLELAKGYEHVTIEIVRSLKYRCNVLLHEQESSRNL